jgi:hypothetical protein
MLIFTNNDLHYIFIHIPKNGGKYIRDEIINDENNEIVKSYWNVQFKLDLAHIPYVKKDNFIDTSIEYNYFTYTRCPYDRIISAFFYRNPYKNIDDFKYFIKKSLTLLRFSMIYDYKIIHYYPQYLFICDENFNIPENIKLYRLDTPKKYELTDYFDDECIKIVNNIYNKDFLLLDYPMIEGTENNV